MWGSNSGDGLPLRSEHGELVFLMGEHFFSQWRQFQLLEGTTHSPIFILKVIPPNNGKNLTFKSPLMGQHFFCPVHVDIKLLLLKQYSLEIFL